MLVACCKLVTNKQILIAVKENQGAGLQRATKRIVKSNTLVRSVQPSFLIPLREVSTCLLAATSNCTESIEDRVLHSLNAQQIEGGWGWGKGVSEGETGRDWLCTHCHLAEDALLLLQLVNRYFAGGSLRLQQLDSGCLCLHCRCLQATQTCVCTMLYVNKLVLLEGRCSTTETLFTFRF